MFSSAILIKISKCVCLSVCLSSVYSLPLDSFPAHKSHVSTRHFASLLSYCDLQRNGTLTLSMASRILQSVPGLDVQSFEICDPHCVALCALTSLRHFTAHSSPVQARNVPAALYPNSTTPESKTPRSSFSYAALSHPPVFAEENFGLVSRTHHRWGHHMGCTSGDHELEMGCTSGDHERVLLAPLCLC